MKFIMRLTGVLFLCLLTASAFAYFFCLPRFYRGYKSKSKPFNTSSLKLIPKTGTKNNAATLSISPMGLKKYLKANNFNTTHCFLIDMKIESGKKRFFVYNVLKDSVEIAGLVTHGSGTEGSDTIQFSNEPNSLCTSLGKYKIGKSYNGKFGLAYKLYGLDKTNSNAFNRFVVLHSHSCVPSGEVYPHNICVSWGCPTVAPSFLQQLQAYIDNSPKPILLEIRK
jgi:L,D-transpeptidase catalytic domain